MSENEIVEAEAREITGNTFGSYENFKRTMDAKMKETAAGFVQIGYLLKVARDTDVLQGSGYSGMGDFAQAEYGLDPSQTSRFIAINDRYSDGGNSDHLLPQYADYGYAKLAEMLTLPSAVADAIGPDFTKDEIREIKAEVKAEEKISDIETMIEPVPMPAGGDLLFQAIRQYYREFPREYIEVVEALSKGDMDGAMDIIAPDGMAMLVSRVPGTGRVMISIKSKEDPIEMVIVRENRKETYTLEVFQADLKEAVLPDAPAEGSPRQEWEEIYKQPFPEEKEEPEPKAEEPKPKKPEPKKKVKIAPAQPKKHQENTHAEPIPEPEKPQETISEAEEAAENTHAEASNVVRFPGAEVMNAPEQKDQISDQNSPKVEQKDPETEQEETESEQSSQEVDQDKNWDKWKQAKSVDGDTAIAETTKWVTRMPAYIAERDWAGLRAACDLVIDVCNGALKHDGTD